MIPSQLLTTSAHLLQLRDKFVSSRLGRHVVVRAPSREVATAAITAVLFDLCHGLKKQEPLEQAQWRYYGDKVGRPAALGAG